MAFSFSRVILLSQPAILSVMLSHMSGRAALDRRRMHDHAPRFLVAALLVGCVLLWMVGEVPAGLIRWMPFPAATRLILRFPLPRLYLVRDDFRYILGLLR